MAHEKEWEKHARNSRHSAFLTFIGAAVVVVALVISYWQLSSLPQNIDARQAQVDVIDAKIENAKVELEQLLSALQDSVRITDQAGAEKAVENAAGGVTARFNLLKKETEKDVDSFVKVAKKPVTAKKKQAAERAEQIAKASPAGESAFIASNEDFVICRSLNNRQPEGIANEFDPGNVYVWARVQAPKNEPLILRWQDQGDNVIRTKYLRVQQNMQNGYRVYDYKTFSGQQKGAYYVLLFNEKGDQIARAEFVIR